MNTIYALLIIHFFADFVAQTHEMATNKWKLGSALWSHIGSYTFILFIGLLVFFHTVTMWVPILAFTLYNGFWHLIIDSVTAPITHDLAEKQSWHNFFVVVGFDQLLHTGLLIWSAYILK